MESSMPHPIKPKADISSPTTRFQGANRGKWAPIPAPIATNNTNLPPLLPNDAISPRRDTNVAALSPPHELSGSAGLDRDYPVAQVDPWPLTRRNHQFWSGSTASALPYEMSPAQYINAANVSPISPRQRQANTRRKLVEESKSKPVLLQEIEAFVCAELDVLQPHRHHDADGDGEGEGNASGTSRKRDEVSSSPRKRARPHSTKAGCIPSLQRLQVFRSAFDRIIEAFTVYAPLLSQIQAEYEQTIRWLRSQNLQIPQLRDDLQTIQTQCLHEISAYNLETKRRYQELKRQLKQTQGELTACAAMNSQYLEENTRLKDKLAAVEKRNSEMQLSNHSLVNGIKRHDETLRHLHDRCHDEQLVVQQITSKYFHACEEIAELKRTIASLEEKVGGVHVAADKATIALLTKDLQELNQRFLEEETKGRSASADLNGDINRQIALNHAFLKVFEAEGVPFHLEELLERLEAPSSITSSNSLSTKPSIPPFLSPMPSMASISGSLSHSTSQPVIVSGKENNGIDQLAAFLIEKLRYQHRRQHLLQQTFGDGNDHLNTNSSAVSGDKDTTFLTEPEEQCLLSAATTQLLAPFARNDFLPCQGTAPNVPEYLQHDGVVRNLHYPLKKVEQIIARVWQQKEDLEKVKRSYLTSTTASAGALHIVPLGKVLTMHLQRICASRSEAVECAYNLVAAMERFSKKSTECRLFLLILRGELPEEARDDQAKEVIRVHDALFAIEKEQTNYGTRYDSAISTATIPPPGHLHVSQVVWSLRLIFPWKTDAQLSELVRALLLDLRGSSTVDYAALLLVHQEAKQQKNNLQGQQSVRGAVVQCLRSQYVDDLLAFRHHIESNVADAIAKSSFDQASEVLDDINTSSSNGMISLKALRECIQQCDVSKPIQDINRLVTIATGLTMDQILTQDALMINGRQFLGRLPTMLIKPTGKYNTLSDQR